MLIGVEWTSQAFCADLIEDDGRVIDVVQNATGTTAVRDRRFAETFSELLPQVWRNQAKAAYFSGMITGRGGWVETGFVAAPAGLSDIGRAAVTHADAELTLTFLPGVSSLAALPDVMRGEEIRALAAAGQANATVVMPGLHTKFVTVEAERIARLGTYMGGETAKLLSRDSLVSRLIPDGAAISEAGFDRGVATAWDQSLPGGALRRLFSARSLVLFDRMPPDEIAGYILGLLVGAEIAEAEQEWPLRNGPVLVLGPGVEAQRYIRALRQRGIEAEHRQVSAAPSFAKLHQVFSRPEQFA
jgi:2-dehydro-3-deoxygalactonokinase